MADNVTTVLRTVYANVRLGANVQVDDYVVLGRAPKDKQPGELGLDIGDDSVIRSHTVIYAGSQIGRRFQSGHSTLIREYTCIGDDCSVGSGSVVEFKVTMGARVRLHSRVFVPEFTVLEDDAWLGPGVVVTNAKFPRSARVKETLQGVRIGRGAKIGANATLLPGIVIGAGALVGAGSVVTRDVEPGSVVLGNPARKTGMVFDLTYRDTGLKPYSKE